MTIQRILRKKVGTSNPSSYVGTGGEIFLDDSIPDLRLSDGATPGGLSLSIGAAGIVTYALNAGYAGISNIAGIATVALGLTGTPNLNVGVVTATTFYGNGVNLTGVVTSLVGYATTGYVNNAITGFITSGALIGYATTGYVTTQIGLNTFVGAASTITSGQIFNWNTAYSWGNHATVGYLTSANLIGYATEGYVNSAVVGFISSGNLTGYANTAGIATVAQGLTGTPDISVNQVGIASHLFVSGITTFLDNVNIEDGKALLIGDNNDLQLFHSGVDSFIDNLSAGNLIIRDGGIGIQLRRSGGGPNAGLMAAFNNDAGVELYYNSFLKLQTFQNGVAINDSVGIGTTAGNPPYRLTVSGIGATITQGLENAIADLTSSVDGYGQVNIRNSLSAPNASGDLVITADIGDDSSNFVNFGINNTGFSTSSWTINGALDGYLYTSDGNLSIGAGSANKYLSLFAGGTLASNEQVRVTTTGVGIGTTNATSKLTVGGDVRISGIVTANSFRPSSGYYQSSNGTNAFYVYDTTGNVAFQGTIGVNQINSAAGYKALEFSGNTLPVVMVTNGLNVTGVTTSSNGFVGNLTGTATTSGYATTSGVSTYSSTAGVSTYAQTSGISTYASTAGVSTVAQGLTGTPNLNVGVITATSYNGSGVNLTGVITSLVAGTNVTITQTAGIATISASGGGGSGDYATVAGFATASGISTSVVGGVGIITQLSVSAITTTTNLNVTGIGTFLTTGLKVRNPANTFQYNITSGAIAADRTLNLPVITATDTLAVLGLSQTFSATQTFSSTLTASGTLDLTGSTTGTHLFGSNQTSGTLTFGGASGTGTITLGRATTSQTTDIQAGITASGSTKTINLGTNGASGSFTRINVGPTAGIGTIIVNTGSNLGIGSTLPTSTVDVVGSGKFTGIVTASRFDSVTAGTPIIESTDTISINTPKVAISTDLTVGGNTGIGTTNATSKLHVLGDVLVSGVTTSTNGFVGNLTGTATTATNAQGLTGTPNITVGVATITGNLNAPGNYYVKIARLTDQTISNGADTLIGFSTMSDQNNWFTFGTSSINPTVAGTYYVSLMVNWNAGSITTDQTNIQIRKNTETFSLSQVGIRTFAYTQNACGIVTMNGTTDYIDCIAYTANPTSQDINGTADGAWTKMEIFKIN